MVTVKQLIEALKKYDENDVITIDAHNDDGAADATLCVGGSYVLSLVDYYNSDQTYII